MVGVYCYNLPIMSDKEQHRSIKEGSKFILTHRALEDYEYFFQFDAVGMPPNARVLDVGSGVNQEFAFGMRRLRPDIQVASIDPSIILPTDDKSLDEFGIEYRVAKKNNEEERNKRLMIKDRNLVAALAPNLPIKTNSCDYIFDSHGAYLYTSDNQTKKDYLKELMRIGKPNAFIGIYPLKEIAEDSLRMFIEGKVPFEEIKDEVRKKIRRDTEGILQSLWIINYEFFEREDVTHVDRQQGKTGSIKVGLIIHA
jgi:ubiquinone/menaquinone biosynthesis C-methylase UbiE